MDVYGIPHGCESAELAGLLARLTPKQRRVLRQYVWEVELGQQTVTRWLESEKCLVRESSWYRRGDHAHYANDPVFTEALEAYKTAGIRWQANEEQRAVAAGARRLRMATPQAAERVVGQVQGDIGVFFKVVERWTQSQPLPSQEIIDEQVAVDSDGVKHRSYLVRQVVVDLDKLRDPKYSCLVRKFSDSPRSGLSLELHDAQRAAFGILDRAGRETAAKSDIGLVPLADLVMALRKVDEADDESAGDGLGEYGAGDHTPDAD